MCWDPNLSLEVQPALFFKFFTLGPLLIQFSTLTHESFDLGLHHYPTPFPPSSSWELEPQVSVSQFSLSVMQAQLSPPPSFSTPPKAPQLWPAAGRHHELFPCYFPAPEFLASEQLVSSRSLGGALWSRQGAARS